MSDRISETKEITSLSEIRHDAVHRDESAFINIDDLPAGAVLEVRTERRTYLVENAGNGQVRLQGHPQYCPDPVLVTLCSAVGGGQASSPLVVGPDLFLIYRHPTAGLVRTSRIVEVRRLEGRVSVTEAATDA